MNKLYVAVAICAALASSYVSAEVKVNGFASIICGKSLDSESTLYGYGDDFTFKNEKRFCIIVICRPTRETYCNSSNCSSRRKRLRCKV